MSKKDICSYSFEELKDEIAGIGEKAFRGAQIYEWLHVKLAESFCLLYTSGMAASVNGRELVLDILLQITRDGEYSHIALKNVLDKYQYLDKKERAFITRVVNGTLEHMIEIDYIINQFSKVKVQKMKPVIRTIIRSAVYQLKYMDSVPDSAVLNEAVKLASKRGFSTLKGLDVYKRQEAAGGGRDED